jgi:hypothetical protein
MAVSGKSKLTDFFLSLYTCGCDLTWFSLGRIDPGSHGESQKSIFHGVLNNTYPELAQELLLIKP